MTEPLDCFAPGILAGEVAVITGGGTGIGRVTALGLAALGADIVIASRDPAHLTPTVAELEAVGV